MFLRSGKMETNKDMNVVIEYIAEIGLDAVKDKINNQKVEIAVRNRIKDYLQCQEKLNFSCTREEEIDFEELHMKNFIN